MKFDSTQLIDDLVNRTERSTIIARRFKSLNILSLNHKKNPDEWSALECIEHLNLYGNYYLPEIEKEMLAQKPNSSSLVFKSGVIGNYFAHLMLVKPDGSIKKMKSPADKKPVNSVLTGVTIDRFLKQQERLLALLQQARNIDLTKTKTAISLTKLIRLRLGDTFRFFIYHIERHVAQAERAAQGAEKKRVKDNECRDTTLAS